MQNNNKGSGLTVENGYLEPGSDDKKGLLTNGIGENGEHVIEKSSKPVDQQNGTVCFENGDQNHMEDSSFKKKDSYSKNNNHHHDYKSMNIKANVDTIKVVTKNDKCCYVIEEKPNLENEKDSCFSYNSYHDVTKDKCDTDISSSPLIFSDYSFVDVSSRDAGFDNDEQSFSNHFNGDCVVSDAKESHLSESSGVISADDIEVCKSVEKSGVVVENNNTPARNDSCISDSKSIDLASLNKSNEAETDSVISSSTTSLETTVTSTSEKSQKLLEHSCPSVGTAGESETRPAVDGTQHSHTYLENDATLSQKPNEPNDRLNDSSNDDSSDYDEHEQSHDVSDSTSSHATNRPKESPQRSPKHLLPELQLLNLTYTSLTANTVKLKWNQNQPQSAQPHQIHTRHYVVEMLFNKANATTTGSTSSSNTTSNGTNDHSDASSKPIATRIVYQGYSTNCRISHLSPQQQYSFRARTTSQDHLVVSNVLTITTPEQQPVTAKSHTKKNKQQLLQQQIQQQQHQLHQQQLLLQQQQQQNQQANLVKEASESAISSDQKCAILILLAFTLFALVVAVIIQAFIRSDE